MIKKSIFIIVLQFVVLCSFAQKSKEIDVSFLINNKEVENVQYYIVDGPSAYSLEKRESTILIDNKHLGDDKEDLKILVKYKNNNIDFFIKPQEIHYLKISKMPFCFRYFLKRKYVINQGFDYEDIVGISKIKYNFVID